MYQTIIDTFIEGCRNLIPELAKEIFHEKLMYKGCTKGNAKDLMLSGLIVSGSSDFDLIKAFDCNTRPW
ncbi:MAG: hypothetical protein E2O88_06600 [Bacteroidetes bacterium]|nr:MAG: hypothetical protein E2O88_06600 [Bacteroidota bacterium]